jgi:phenylpropionate dioxygenase-like ring-hydroxylating dioxygenase large terminal subunit
MSPESDIALGDLARVGRGTPGGTWLRRYWFPVARSEDLRDIPMAVKVLGEELVLFRDGRGRPGLLGLHCPHRGTSLEYGDIEPEGLRCCYHGWLFDVHGQCLEQPGEPPESTFYRKVRHLAYPVQELGGLLFAYLGPGTPPPLPRYRPLVDHSGQRRLEPVRYMDYNWFNFWENGADPVHLWVLHRQSGYGQGSWGNAFFDYANPPHWQLVETAWGLQIVMTKPGPTPDTEFVDTFCVAFPSIIQVGDTEFAHLKLDEATTARSNNDHFLFLTPQDDEHFMIFTVDYYTGPDPDFFEKLQRMRAQEQPPKPREYDRRKYAAFRGVIRLEDTVAQSTQGPLWERRERLGVEDRGVILLRKMVREAIQAAIRGERPRGVLSWEEADRVIDLGSFVGLRPRTHAVHS